MLVYLPDQKRKRKEKKIKKGRWGKQNNKEKWFLELKEDLSNDRSIWKFILIDYLFQDSP